MLKFDWHGEQLTTREIMDLHGITGNQKIIKRYRGRLKKLRDEGEDMAKAFDEAYWQQRVEAARDANLRKAKEMAPPAPPSAPDEALHEVTVTRPVDDSLAALIDVLRQARRRIMETDKRLQTLEREYVHARKLWVTAMQEIERLRDVINNDQHIRSISG